MVKASRFTYAVRFDGEPKLSNFEYVTEDLPDIKDGEVLCEAIYVSVDPFQRAYIDKNGIGVTVIGGQIAKVIESKSKKFPVGCFIYGEFGWCTHTIFSPGNRKDLINPYILPDFGKLSKSLGLGVLGMPGNTAYFGFLELCQPEYGDTVVISGAGGAVGSLVGQIAKMKGCKVIGLAGTDEKCEWLKKEIGFDHTINYKTCDVNETLLKVAPSGIDCYFDNVGGEITSIVMTQMGKSGRIALCGCISTYNLKLQEWPKVLPTQSLFAFNQLKMEGFMVYRWAKHWLDGITQMLEWVEDGKIKYHETITHGFENTPQAFIDMLNGKNIGKAVVKCK